MFRYIQRYARTAYEKIALTSLVATDLRRARRVASARAEELGLAPQQSLRVDPDAEVAEL
jgi:broad specificity phosphatase PhoE